MKNISPLKRIGKLNFTLLYLDCKHGSERSGFHDVGFFFFHVDGIIIIVIDEFIGRYIFTVRGRHWSLDTTIKLMAE